MSLLDLLLLLRGESELVGDSVEPLGDGLAKLRDRSLVEPAEISTNHHDPIREVIRDLLALLRSEDRTDGLELFLKQLIAFVIQGIVLVDEAAMGIANLGKLLGVDPQRIGLRMHSLCDRLRNRRMHHTSFDQAADLRALFGREHLRYGLELVLDQLKAFSPLCAVFLGERRRASRILVLCSGVRLIFSIAA